MRWSPFLPVDCGVAPFPNLSHANMDLQMCIPLSLTILVLMTSHPLACCIRAMEYPSRLFLTCPRCSGLLVLGEEYSTMSVWFRLGNCPYCGLLMICCSCSAQKCWLMVRFKNPCTALKAATICGHLLMSCSPISFASCAGAFLTSLMNGKMTNVMCP